MKVKVKVPSEESLMFFKERWNGQPFFGEYEPPMYNGNDSEWINRILTTDPKNISHMINSIDWTSFDPATSTVLIDVDFVGPYGQMAISDWLKGNIRFAVRTILVKNKRRMITWDIIHKPIDIGKGSQPEKTQEQVDREGRTNELVEKLQKEIIDSDDGTGGINEDPSVR